MVWEWNRVRKLVKANETGAFGLPFCYNFYVEIKILYKASNPDIKPQVVNFLKENFLEVGEDWEKTRKEVNEDFFSDPNAFLIMYDGAGEIAGCIWLLQRTVYLGGMQLVFRRLFHNGKIKNIAGKKINCGGIGGVCVRRDARHNGYATKMLERGLKELESWKCDICYLNTDKPLLYERVGFVKMPVQPSYFNRHFVPRHSEGSMLAPVCSKKVFEKVLQSNRPLNLGYGNW